MTPIVNALFAISAFVGSLPVVAVAGIGVVIAVIFGWALFTWLDPLLVKLYLWAQGWYHWALIGIHAHFARCLDYYDLEAAKEFAGVMDLAAERGNRVLESEIRGTELNCDSWPHYKNPSDPASRSLSHKQQAEANTGLNEQNAA